MKFLLGTVIFLGAFLSFQVQPLTGSSLLPAFGSTPAVWTTCLIFFQLTLLVGYLYAHLSKRYLNPQGQLLLHVALVGLTALTLPLNIGAEEIKYQSAPQLAVLIELMKHVGPTFIILSATTPLLQSWFERSFPRSMGWRLYALSNFGSVLALLVYPLVLNVYFGLSLQQSIWSIIFVGYGATLTITAAILSEQQTYKAAPAPSETLGSTNTDIIKWLCLSGASCFVLVGISTRLTQDIPATPVIFTLPLLLYLLTFIITFERTAAYSRIFAAVGLVLGVVAYALEAYATYDLTTHTRVGLICGVGLFVFYSMHGELARSLPNSSDSTLFYLVIAAGGAIGGVLSGIIAPLAFDDFYEYPLGLIGSVYVAIFIWFKQNQRKQRVAVVTLGLIASLTVILVQQHEKQGHTIHQERNFFGVLRVNDTEPANDADTTYRELMYGEILHGYQHSDQRGQVPRGYYSPQSGLGVAIQNIPLEDQDAPLSIAVIGLGTGQIATWVSPATANESESKNSDSLDFFEINPEIKLISDNHFSYLADAKERGADINTFIGDGRLELKRRLESHGRAQYHVIVMDAFLGGAIPTHLVTRESMALYLALLKNSGVIAFHISNRYLDLKPVMNAFAEEFSLFVGVVNSRNDGIHSEWVLLSRSQLFFQQPKVKANVETLKNESILWTDEHHSIIPLLKR